MAPKKKPPKRRPFNILTEFQVDENAAPATDMPRNTLEVTSAVQANNHDRSTVQQANIAAQDAVFSTQELVENIVSFLSGKNVFGVLRVSKMFKSAIDQSPALQYKMFLGPKPRSENDDSSPALTHQHLIPFRLLQNHRDVSRPTQLVCLNPRLEQYLQFRRAREEHYYHEEILTFVLEDIVPRDPSTGNFVAQDPSFLDTYLTDPPCQALYVEINADYDLPAPTGLWKDRTMTYSLCRGINRDERQVNTGPSIRALVNAASQRRQLTFRRTGMERVATRSNPNGINPIKTGEWELPQHFPCDIPVQASLSEALDLIRAADATHAAAINQRRTHVNIRMLHTIVWRHGGTL